MVRVEGVSQLALVPPIVHLVRVWAAGEEGRLRELILLEAGGGLFVAADQAGFGMTTEELKIWFGILALIVVELGLITPPVGLNLYILQGLTGEDLGRTVRAALPFFLLLCLGTALLAVFPQIALWLPDLLFAR